MKHRLIELLQGADKECAATKQCENCVGFGKGGECINYLIADYLLKNEVFVLPCKVGDTLYINYKYLRNWESKTYPVRVNAIRLDTKKNNHRICVRGTFHLKEDYSHNYMATFKFDSIGKTLFRTREEAEQALVEMKGEPYEQIRLW